MASFMTEQCFAPMPRTLFLTRVKLPMFHVTDGADPPGDKRVQPDSTQHAIDLLNQAIDALDKIGEPVAAAYADMARSVILDKLPQS